MSGPARVRGFRVKEGGWGGGCTKGLASPQAGVPGPPSQKPQPPCPSPTLPSADASGSPWRQSPPLLLAAPSWQGLPAKLRLHPCCSPSLSHAWAPMANSALNHSWPALSKLWLKRWAFKRGKGVSSDQQARPPRQGSLDSLEPFFGLGHGLCMIQPRIP